MLRAVDVGFGRVKGRSVLKDIEFPSAIGDFKPIRFTNGIEEQKLEDRLCIEYEGNRYFVGDIAYEQSVPRVTMSGSRFTSQEGLSLMLSALIILSNNQAEEVKVVVGLPVNDYAGLENDYKSALERKHYIQLIRPDGSNGDFYSFNIDEVKILPQPMGTIFNKVLSEHGEFTDINLASGRIAVLDIGKHTVDLALTDKMHFIDNKSTSFNDIGIFDAYKDLSLELKALGYDIAPDSLDPYITSGKDLKGLSGMKERVFKNQADKVISRVVNTWSDLWSFDKILITGGGSLLLGSYIANSIDSDKVEICNNPTMTNCSGYFKFGKKVWSECLSPSV